MFGRSILALELEVKAHLQFDNIEILLHYQSYKF